jgi:hypothetical protein
MEMVGHDNEFINLDRGKFVVDFHPPPGNHFTGVAINHFPAIYLPKQACPILDTNSNEIRTRLAIIIAL